MRLKNFSYPHPVLGNWNDIEGSFSWEFRYYIGSDLVSITPSFILAHGWLEKEIENENACFTLEVQCWSTFFRKSFQCKGAWMQIDLPAQSLRWKVEVGFFICASDKILVYQPDGMHSDYGDSAFSISKGDVLAIGGGNFFIADKDFDPLKPPTGSLIQICMWQKMSAPIEISYDWKKIQAILSKDDWKRYSHLPKSWIECILHWAIVFPVLLDALYEWKKGDQSEYYENEWFEKFSSIIERRWLSSYDPFEMTQRILLDPVSRTLISIEELIANDDAND
jgi:hypothetical protein